MLRTSYHAANNFTDSSSGSISTSPSSAASSLQAYTDYPANNYTSVATFPGPVQLTQAFVPSSYAATRVPSMYVINLLCHYNSHLTGSLFETHMCPTDQTPPWACSHLHIDQPSRHQY